MMKGILLFLLIGGSDKEYSATERYNDSILIYNTYQSEIDFLKKLKDTDRQQWYALEANNERLTACAKVRLKKFNHKSYEPVTTFDRKGYGMAHAYAKPGVKEHAAPQAFTFAAVPKFHFVVYDKQTRFLSITNCALRIPYILKMVYDKGRLLFTEKLNPVTMQKLVAEGMDNSSAENNQ